MIYLEYLVLASLTVFLSVKLSNYVDALDRKTNLSGAFIGGVMLAAVTSLPEVFTSLTAVFQLDKPGLVLGNVLGSNIFNFSIFGVLMILYTKKYVSSKVALSHESTLMYTVMMYLFTLGALNFKIDVNFLGLNFNIFSILILIIYGISVWRMQGDNSGDSEEEDTCPLSVKQVIIRFIIFSILLVITSIVLTGVSDKLSTELNLGATVGGAIFLGVATSLPELSASFSLVKMNNFNASIGNIVGSCCFNFIILGVSDLFYSKAGLYGNGKDAIAFAVAGIVASVVTMIALKKKDNSVFVKVCGIAIVLAYVLSLVFTM